MKVITDPKQAGERLLQFARENRLVQNTWHAETDGREVACLLGAAAGINDAIECPASLMPPWMAYALPLLFDGQTEAQAQTFARRWGEAMVRSEWARIDWDALRDEWMAFVVEQAQNAAHAADEAAAYAAASADDADAAWAASWASAAAADAAETAETAARAADAADAADAAAAAAAYAAANDGDAYAAARDAQADALMDAIEKAMEVARG